MYWYFETPDYADCHKKVGFVTFWSFAASSVISIYDIIGFTRPQTFQHACISTFRIIAPFTASMAMGAAVQCAVSNLRGKKDDDLLSYTLGGATIGLIWGMKLRKGSLFGAWLVFSGAVVGTVTKIMNMEGVSALPQLPNDRREWGSGTFASKYGGDLTFGIKLSDTGGRRVF